MKEEVTIPPHFPEKSEEKLRAEARRREKYSLVRDVQAIENNEAIARRLAREKEDQDKAAEEVKP
jgi:hypothetical protein